MSQGTSPLSQIGSVVFRLLLVASLWEGPQVTVHTHGSLTEDLATHLATFHAHDADPAHLGWHWHLTLPEDESGDQPSRSRSLMVVPDHGVSMVAQGCLTAATPFYLGSRPAVTLRQSVRASGTAEVAAIPALSPQLVFCHLSC